MATEFKGKRYQSKQFTLTHACVCRFSASGNVQYCPASPHAACERKEN